MQRIISLDCPGCGAPVSAKVKNCPYCDKPIIISSFLSIYKMPTEVLNRYTTSYNKVLNEEPENGKIHFSLGMCYLKLGIYEKAIDAFEKSFECDLENSDSLFFAALSLLRGKKAFLAQRNIIDKIEEYLNAANKIEPKGIHFYYLAYIKYDYFKRKYLKTSPSYNEALDFAYENGLSEDDTQEIFQILNVPKPHVFES